MQDQLTVPLSPAQRLLCWVDEVTPGMIFGPRFVAVGGYRISGPLDVSVLRGALDRLVVRHRALRTAIVRDDGVPYQSVRPPAPVPLTEVAPDLLIDTIVAGEYPPGSPSLLWAFLARHDPTDATLVLVAQHTVADPWSMRILITDLLRTYGDSVTGWTPAGSAEQADPVPVPPGGSVPAAPRHDEQRLRRLTDHWRQVLADPPELPLPAAAPGGDPRTSEVRFPLSVTEPRLRAAARPLRTTPFVLLLSGFMGALGTLTGATDLAVPVLTYGRDRSDWDTVGLFMNALPVRADLTGDLTATQTVARVHAAFAAAFSRELPLTELLSRLPEAVRFFAPDGPVCAQFEVIQLPPAQSSAPLSHRPLRLPGGLPLGGPVIPVNGLVTWLEQDSDGGYTGTIRYRADLFGPDTIDRLVRCYADRLDELVGL
ncbi:condensation domain-containing protein [Micromonospora sp. NBC_01699]|uniref:condensation domain-containing protein n=1 Tax=Micromonospora sp. NBC_01699 TaxID=2975984 RepID=UPI002E2DE699|nr:condensation domain-containing protein [Micromonospora sp. NBC_01699]